LTDSNGCEVFQILNCTFGCSFEITVQEVTCIFNVDIENSSYTLSVVT
jgi:hypothetical protein